MSYPAQPITRVEFHSADGSVTILEGEALAKWAIANHAMGTLWASRGWGDAGHAEAFALARHEGGGAVIGSPVRGTSHVIPAVSITQDSEGQSR